MSSVVIILITNS